MKLKDIESKNLLPRFADKIAWVQNAFDAIVKAVFARAKSIDAPLTMESIQALTDEELQALYEQYGIAQYYPDLSRDTRDKMLYEMCRIYRYLGTPKAVEILCDYIFDGVPLNLRLKDNLAFDETGHLVDESLLDIFDIEIEPQVASLPQSAQDRIIANILRFSRNSQTLRDIYYEYPQSFALTVSEAISGDDAQVTSEWEQDSLCVPIPIEAPQTYIVINNITGDIEYSANDIGLQYSKADHVEMPDAPLLIIVETPSQFDVWIESVDTVNNVVVALRSVFTGLTAARANTIVNNAPTYLSRYNNYLSNQGGPFSQADAITMRDRLQSYIPSGDTSTFGIRPVST